MNNNKGFTLFELLIALLIISVGVLGHAKMQIKSMETAQRASFAQSASIALSDLAHRMRANSDVANNFEADNLLTGDAISATKNCSTAVCTDSEFAQAELSEWFTHIQQNLPLPRFSVTESANVFTVTLIWDAGKTGVGSGTCSTSSSTYQCASMEVWIP